MQLSILCQREGWGTTGWGGDWQGTKMTTHAWKSIKPFEIKNGGRSLEFYHEIRHQFSTYKMDFGHESWCLEFLKLLSSSRLVFKAISSSFPKQICGHLQLYKDGSRRQKENNSVWVSSVFKVYICKKESSIISEENIKNDFFSFQWVFLIVESWERKAKREAVSMSSTVFVVFKHTPLSSFYLPIFESQVYILLVIIFQFSFFPLKSLFVDYYLWQKAVINLREVIHFVVFSGNAGHLR